jgi:hypothetical protein
MMTSHTTEIVLTLSIYKMSQMCLQKPVSWVEQQYTSIRQKWK